MSAFRPARKAINAKSATRAALMQLTLDGRLVSERVAGDHARCGRSACGYGWHAAL
jgi:hypothetical protein